MQSIQSEKLIITAAVTGGMFPSCSPHTPISPDAIAKEVKRCYDVGATVAHIHARNPKTGQETGDLGIWDEILKKTKKICDIVVCFTSHNHEVIQEFSPEFCSFPFESVTVGIPADVDYSQLKQDWEQQAYYRVKSASFHRDFNTIERDFDLMEKYNTVPEFELFGVNGLNTFEYYQQQNKIGDNPFILFELGPVGQTKATISNVQNCLHGLQEVRQNKKFQWGVAGFGYPASIRMAAISIVSGGHVRVGFEDCQKITPTTLATSNAEFVHQVVDLSQILGRDVASITDTREILGLKGLEQVNY
jgi:uncharacterized protein (DUF849 family)